MEQTQQNFLEAINTFQRCQRNFDLSIQVEDKIIDWLMDIGYSTPTKHNLNSFEIVCIKDRKIIKEFSIAATNPPEERYALSENLKEQLARGRIQNPQTDSNLLFLFFLKKETRKSNDRLERERGNPVTNHYWEKCTNLEIGLAASAIGIAATTIGMKTGFCRCMDIDAIPNVLEPYNIDKNDLEIMLGIGYPLYDDHTKHTDGKYTSSSYEKNIPRKLII